MIDGPLAGLPKEYIPFVYFKQYLPVSNKVKVVFFIARVLTDHIVVNSYKVHNCGNIGWYTIETMMFNVVPCSLANACCSTC